jgi:hypothetical protein
VPAIVPSLLVCDLVGAEFLKVRFPERALWRRIVQNQDERYHALPSPEIPGAAGSEAQGAGREELIMDFKKCLAMPMEAVYDGIARRTARRVALIGPVYIHDLMHRFYSFLSRVGVD